MGHVYVLRLENEKYYVGWMKSSNIKRPLQHIDKKGAKWTKLHPPLKDDWLYSISEPGKTTYHEDTMFLKMAKKFGIENVRGGQWCMVRFDKYIIRDVQREIDRLFKTKRRSKRKGGYKCAGISKVKGTRCGIKVFKKGDFCVYHKDQAENPVPQYSHMPPGIHDEGRLTEEQEYVLEDWHAFGVPFDKSVSKTSPKLGRRNGSRESELRLV